jgi:hypothetical protein
MSRKLVVGISVVAGAIAVGLLGKSLLNLRGLYVERYLDGRLIPPRGLRVNPVGLTGLTRDSESDFKKLYKAIRAYGAKTGKFPDDPRVLIEFTREWSVSDRITPDAFCSPDYKKSDYYFDGDDGFSYKWTYRSPRPDGSPKPLVPGKGERDTWLVTDVLSRSNRIVYRDGTYSIEPEGYLLVLWSDGTVQRGAKTVKVPDPGTTSHSIYYAGEAGLPLNAIPTNDELPSKGNWWPPPNKGALPR